MINQVSKLFLVLLAVLSFNSNAFAIPGMNVGIMAGPNLAFPSASLPAGSSMSGTIGYSVGPSVGLGPIEVSALYSSYGLKVTASGSEATSSGKSLDLPVLYRLGIGPVGFGIGGFYNISLESGSTSSDNNYGAVASFRTTIPGIGLFVDGRFSLGLHDMSGTKLSSGAVLIGYNFL